MSVSREYALKEMRSMRRMLSAWVQEIEKPSLLSGGVSVPSYPEGVPFGLSVNSLKGVPSEQFRAELLAMSGRLEALASNI